MYKEIVQDSNIIRYIVSYNSFNFANGLAGSFLNILFFSAGNLTTVIEYQFAYQISQLFTFVLSGLIVNYVQTKFIYSLSTPLRAISLIGSVLIGGIFMNQFFFGFIYGFSSGLFWAGNAIIAMEVSRGKDRLAFLSFNSTVAYIASLVSPIIGGVALQITPFSGTMRYVIVFAATAALLVYSGASGLFINVTERQHPKIRFLDSIRANKHVKWQFKSYFYFSSFYGLALSIILPVYIFKITGSYTIVGILVASMAASSALGNILTPRMLNRKSNSLLPYLYSIAIILASIVFIGNFNIPITVLFLAGDVALLLTAPMNNRSMSNFMNSVDLLTTSFPYWVNREYYLLAGRYTVLIALLAVFIISGFSHSLYVLTIMSLTVLPTIPAINATSQL
ncbi:MAG: MFS transporter [Candidatus Thermoplasmatota archaeon]|nr:MFS transporter [Candidatus Thermoplasmatota archaeon]